MNPSLGTTISAFPTRVSAELGPAGVLISDDAPHSLAGGGIYRLVGSENCTRE